MKMFRLNGHREAVKIAGKLRYTRGLLVDHDEAYVFVPMAVSHVHYNDVRRAFISLKHSLREEQHRDIFELMSGYSEVDEEENWREQF
jgi:hypothetical protein